jgi:hypothetical protein
LESLHHGLLHLATAMALVNSTSTTPTVTIAIRVVATIYLGRLSRLNQGGGCNVARRVVDADTHWETFPK